ncbi:hypothetical protein ARMSODRAFT_230986 [Armillaria solidipes]|uniref:Uncharacterized protein n=1 Tax=Armillaria solidipes TaxID=1076256 RepID=A0A2H3CDW0_9AGAR|nr:hypothetical protein ARMSODRAFT_230986 [Armillaria solidipes]
MQLYHIAITTLFSLWSQRMRGLKDRITLVIRPLASRQQRARQSSCLWNPPTSSHPERFKRNSSVFFPSSLYLLIVIGMSVECSIYVLNVSLSIVYDIWLSEMPSSMRQSFVNYDGMPTD